MGCTFDKIMVQIDREDALESFVNIFNTVLKDDLYDEDDRIILEDFEDEGDCYILDKEAEPLFSYSDAGQQLNPMFEQFLRDNPDVEFYAEYECSFSNCSDHIFSKFEYEGGVLNITTRSADSLYVRECPECGYQAEDEDELVSIDTWEEGMVCTCPDCGAEIPYTANEDVVAIVIVEN